MNSTASLTPDFAALVAANSIAYRFLAEQAARAVNASLTFRNWLVGAHIREYEQQGADRAQYGEALFDRLSQALTATGTVRYHPRELRRCRELYIACPEFRGAVSTELSIPPERLVQSLSFSHFVELIGDEHCFIDLVFYHRILKCHVLVDLKLAEFSHENVGQLNTYVSWYKKNMMLEGDNPPIGILLCTRKNHSLVEFALAGMDNYLFVSKYQLELPKREEIERFLAEKLKP